MELKKFFGKTLEAVKKSARQMYGDDFIVLDTSPPDKHQKAGITVMAAKRGAGKNGRDSSKESGDKGAGWREPRDEGANTKGSYDESSGRNLTDGDSGEGDSSSKMDGEAGDDRSGSRNRSGSQNRPDRRGTRFKAGRTRHRKRDKLGRFVKQNRDEAVHDDEHPTPDDPSAGRSAGRAAAGKKSSSSSNLEALRKYAEKQELRSVPMAEEEMSSAPMTYSRASIRRQTPHNIKDHAGIREPEDETVQPKNGAAQNVGAENEAVQPKNGAVRNGSHNSDRTGTDLTNVSQRFEPRNLQSNGSHTGPGQSAMRRDRQEVAALHKRFDKLEKLLGSSLISSNFDYVSHPAFQQLVQTGISTSVIARWFSSIIKQGVDPYDQPETFMVKLSGIIRETINLPAEGEPHKYLLFTGPSGSGKTHLIKKLALHDDFMADRKVGVISLLPQGKESEFYYTVMEPFCKDRGIPWFPVRNGKEVTRLLEEWESYDHLLIDTPSISTEQDHSFRQYWKLRQLVTPLAPLEVHYVVNAALSRFYFQQSLATHHPLLPDYVAITHLDEISQWGPIIPFLDEMGCAARYVSTGSSVPYSLKEFNPAWFAQQVLDEP